MRTTFVPTSNVYRRKFRSGRRSDCRAGAESNYQAIEILSKTTVAKTKGAPEESASH